GERGRVRVLAAHVGERDGHAGRVPQRHGPARPRHAGEDGRQVVHRHAGGTGAGAGVVVGDGDADGVDVRGRAGGVVVEVVVRGGGWAWRGSSAPPRPG